MGEQEEEEEERYLSQDGLLHRQEGPDLSAGRTYDANY
jgi:hypothetical protein